MAVMTEPVASALRPPLKWAGGKRWLVPHLLPYWAAHRERRLVEPFCGGLAVTLSLLPERALLNDINPHLIAFYHHLKQGFSLSQLPPHDELAYYDARDRFNALIREGREGSAEAAALFYYLNRTGYNGLCRFNRRGEFNVPFGQYTRITYVKDFSAYQAAFVQWDFSCGDFEQVRVEPDDLIYADPPYDVEFTHYSKEGFTWDDQVRLAHWSARHQGPVILSNQKTERIVALYEGLGFELHYFAAPRRINNTGNRDPAPEVLALKGV